MNIVRKLLLATFAISFAFVIVTCKETNQAPSYKIPAYPNEELIQEEPRMRERHHCRW
ncbi:MAG TPA: hypothetical protein VLE96_02735 [Chlamydiales bacterium]|nr:hypothetical protein [Chlamydiales bacterium]